MLPDSSYNTDNSNIYLDYNSIMIENLLKIIHVGLECGFFLQKRPDLDCISIGPDAGNLHSPEEWLSIPSTMRMFEFIKEIVRKVIE